MTTFIKMMVKIQSFTPTVPATKNTNAISTTKNMIHNMNVFAFYYIFRGFVDMFKRNNNKNELNKIYREKTRQY